MDQNIPGNADAHSSDFILKTGKISNPGPEKHRGHHNRSDENDLTKQEMKAQMNAQKANNLNMAEEANVRYHNFDGRNK